MDSHPCAVLVYKRLGNSLALWRERNQLHIQLNYEEDDATCQLYSSLKEHGISGFCIPVTTHCWTPSSRASKPPVDGDQQYRRSGGSDPVLQSGDQMNASTVKKAMVMLSSCSVSSNWCGRTRTSGTDFSLRYPRMKMMKITPPPTAIRCKLIAWRELLTKRPLLDQALPHSMISVKPDWKVQKWNKKIIRNEKIDGLETKPLRLVVCNRPTKKAKTVTFNTMTADWNEINLLWTTDAAHVFSL